MANGRFRYDVLRRAWRNKTGMKKGRVRLRSPSMSHQDKRILDLYFGSINAPLTPKEILYRLKLQNIWIVYNAIRRFKSKRLQCLIYQNLQSQPLDKKQDSE